MGYARALAPAGGFSRRMLGAAVLALFMAGVFVPSPVFGALITYYVDCAGSDSNLGISQSSPWRSLSKASNAPLLPGDKLLFRRGCVWDGTLSLKRSGTVLLPITVGAYGSGNLPLIQNGPEQVAIYGSYLVIEYLHVRADHDSRDSQCENARMGQRRGFRFFSGAAHSVLQNSLVTDLYGGVWLATGSHHITVRNNVLRDNNMKLEHPEVGDSSGAVGIAVQGDDNDISYNEITGSRTCSRVHGKEGAAIEVFKGQRNRIHHNVSTNNLMLTEFGDKRAADNILAYNITTSTLAGGHYITTRGTSNRYGPVYGTKVYNETVHLAGADSWGIHCYAGCSSSILSIRNSIVWVNGTIGWSDAAFDESRNIYWQSGGNPNVRFPISSSSWKVDPMWTNPGSGDYRLRSGSPAIDSASSVAVNLGFTIDLLGVKVPQGSAPDRGGYEYTGSSATPPPATTTYASDSFSRTVSAGWGQANTGGAYSYDGPSSEFGVNGSAGKMQVASNGGTLAALLPISARSVDIRFRVATSKRLTGGALYVYAVARRNGGSSYRPQLVLKPDGSIAVHAGVVVNDAETPLGSAATVPGVTHTANGFIHVRAQASGANPTTIRMKAWAAGQSEPSGWHYTATNSTSAVQSAGGVGLRVYMSRSVTNPPVVVTFDDFLVTSP
jgi:hypothetical protein